MELDKYRPSDEWYSRPNRGIHGLGHAARVLVWANQIGNWMNTRGAQVDLEVVRWAAVLHDIRRIDDNLDLQHGERAASWLAANPNKIPFEFSPVQLEGTMYCCIWHVPHDKFAPALTPELICLKDADGLDRVRLGNLDSNFLRTEYAKNLHLPAQRLFELSQSSPASDQWLAVVAAAKQLDLWP